MLSKVDSRYPHTYSADHIRAMTSELVLSRADASLIAREIAEIIGMDSEELKKKIADEYIKVMNGEK